MPYIASPIPVSRGKVIISIPVYFAIWPLIVPRKVYAADITYIPMPMGFVYLMAIIDWYSRKVLNWRISISMESDLCAEALKEAIDRYGKPEIFNTDQRLQFTSIILPLS